MAKSKNKQTSQQNSSWTANYGEVTPTQTADTQAIRDWKPQNDPSISYAYSRALGNIKNSFMNPLGADTPQAVRDAVERASYGELGQAEGQTRAEEAYRNNAMNLDRLTYLDQRTRPQVVQTSGTGQGSGTATNTQSATPFGIASTIGSAFLF